jgi:Kef-type K+ transport system membrane component KefB
VSLLDFSVLLILGLIFFFGYLGGLLANRIGLPKVSGYVLVGIILSPSVTGVISNEFLNSSSVIVDFALAMVAFDLGGNLRWNNLKKHKTSIISILFGEGAGAFVSVMLGTFIFMKLLFPPFTINDILIFSIIFGALSVSTAPAATMATIHEYKARGMLTSTLLAVVALDDALGILVFALMLAFIKVVVLGSHPSLSFLTGPVINLILSTLLGILVGLVLSSILKDKLERESVIILTMAFFCFSFGLAQQFALEPLFTTMVLGMTVANLFPAARPFEHLEVDYEPIVLAVFFVLAGAHIDISLVIEYLPLAIVFIIFRLSGKWTGSFIGGMLSATPKNISRYIGFGLAPQAGIAIGLVLYIQRIPALEKYSIIAINVIILQTAITEIIGPYLLKFALKKTGEAWK